MGDSDFIEVFAAAHRLEAALLRDKLIENGIDCRIVGDYLESASGGLPFGHATSPRLWVRQTDARKALELIDELRAAPATHDASEEVEDDSDSEESNEEDSAVEYGPVNWRAVFVASMLLIPVAAFFAWLEFFAEPTTGVGYAKRGDSYYRRGEYQRALEDYSSAILIDPPHPHLHALRGNTFFALGEYREAIDDYTVTLSLNPQFPAIYANRGYCFHESQQFELALSDYKMAVDLGEADAETYNLLAWLLATCPVSDMRDGTSAIQYAKRACELAPPPSWYMLDTLAAAYAEAGEFDAAVRSQRAAIMAAPADEQQSCQEALKLYQAKEPRRDP